MNSLVGPQIKGSLTINTFLQTIDSTHVQRALGSLAFIVSIVKFVKTFPNAK
jgi:hypothetical protein